MINFEKLSDKELYGICKKWGAEALATRRKFAGLLPEVYRREMALWEASAKGGARAVGWSANSWLKKRGFTCLYEFAAELGTVKCGATKIGWLANAEKRTNRRARARIKTG